MRLTLEIEDAGAAPPLPGEGAALVAFMSFAMARGLGAAHPLVALADRMHETFKVRLGPLTTFYESEAEDAEDLLKLELAWQQAGPLRETLEAIATVLATDERSRALCDRGGAAGLPGQVDAALGLVRGAEAAGRRVRLGYLL
ncbi:MAG: hypothetical protein DYG91_00180 [Chloroflexi bacterium CFX7]|nr:MAG: hypothetical protein EDM76_01260 [bacterium]MCE7926907.1 hypothetical protein [Chloroflexi bacterium CFX7]MCK6563120.1 hypothetical protein [Dehalococcoidia bacterium]MCL4232667.1 hypothetical protein [Dehalococcoidia bacterium]RIL02879.1 MAG: hypothetical protein DCC78_05390 [bacterium]